MKSSLTLSSTALIFSLLAGPVAAVPVTGPQAPTDVIELGLFGSAGDAELRGVVEALKQGNRQRAKESLAEIVRKNPNNPRAVEIAGMILLEENNLSAAALSFRRALDLDPASTSALAKLGVTTLLQNRLADGEKLLRQVVAANPKDVLANRYLAWLAETRGESAAVVGYLDKVLAAPEFNANRLTETHLALGRAHLRLGQTAETIQLLSRFAVASGGRQAVPAVLLVAQAHADQHQPAAAEKVLQAATKHLKADDTQLLLVQGSIDMARHAYVPARTKLEKAIARTPAVEGLARERIAATYMDEGKPALAAAEFEKLVAVADDAALHGIVSNYLTAAFAANQGKAAAAKVDGWAKAHDSVPSLGLLHVDALAASGDRDGALAAAKRLTAKRSDYAPAFISLGSLQRALGQRPDAAATLRRATELAPGLPETWVSLAGVFVDTGDWRQAEQALKAGLDANPAQPMLQAEMALLYELSGRDADARALYRTLAARHADNVLILVRASLSLAADTASVEEARRLAASALILSNGDAIAKDAMGWVHVRAGEVAKALPLLEAALKSAPREALFNYHLGAAYLKAGRDADGKRLLENARALGLRPDLARTIAGLTG